MRGFTLSLLSRGCGLVVRSHQDSQDGRLEVCFEPEDYYIWKSHQPLLRLSNSGRFLGGAEPVPPKTYSTRRGPLFLYSEDLASMTTGLPEVSRKRQVSQQSRQEMDLHLHTLRDLTGAILAYGKKRLRGGTATATSLPSLPLPTVLDPLPPSSKVSLAPLRANRQPRPTASQPAKEPGPALPSSPRYHKPPTGLDPLPSKRFFSSRTEGMEPNRTRPLSSLKSIKVTCHVMEDGEECMTEAGWKEKEAEDLRRFEVMVFTPRAHRSPMPETEPPWQVDSGGRPPGTSPNRASLNRTTKHPVGVGVTETADERCYPLNMASVDTSWASSCPSLINFYGGHLVGVRHRQIVRLAGLDRCVQREVPSSDPSLMHPPPSEAPQCCLPPVSLAPLVCQGREAPGMTHDCNALEPRNPGHHLPTIQEGCVRPWGAVGPAQSERTEHQKILLLPLLTPAAGSRGVERRGGDGEKHAGEREKHKRQEREKEDVGGGGKHALPQRVRQQAGVLLEPEEECPPPLGVLPPLARRQGPARQYFLSQYRPDPQDETWEDPRTVVRGILPFELREGQKDQSWGTLIMGPDGEIIQLSLWDPKAGTGGPSHYDVSQENGLRVLSSEGEELPWIILLQPEATDTDRQGGETTDPAGEGMKRNPEDILPNKDASHRIPAPRTGVEGILGDLQQRGERQPPRHRSPSDRDRTGQAPGPHYSDNPATSDKAERNISAASANFTHNKETTKMEAREDAGKDVRKNMKKEPVKKRWKDTEQVKTNRGHRQPAPQSHPSSPQAGQETSSSGHPASEHPNFNPDPTERLSQGTWSGKRNLRNSEGPFTPCGLSPLTRSGGFSENLEESIGSQRAQQRSGGQREEETDRPTRRSRKLGEEPEKDSETLESTTTDPTGIQKKKKRKGKKAEAIQRGSTKEEAGKTSSSGKTMKKGRVKHRAEFVVGKAKANMEVDPGEREEKVEGFKETSPVLSPDTVEKDHMEEDQEDTEEGEEMEKEGEEGEEGEEDSCLDLHTNPDDSEEETALSPVSGGSISPSNQGDSNKSSVGQGGQASSRGHLSSCSAIMATDQLALKPVVSETSNSPSTTKEDVAAARKEQQRAALAEKAERRRQEVERKRREREEERRRQQEREDREERMKMELEEEKRQRAEELRLKRLEEEEERKRRAEEEMERMKREQEEIERDRRRKEEKKRQLERLQRMRQQEEERRAAEMERQRLEEERRREDERKMLLEMEEGERIEYLRRQKEEEEERRRVEEERRKREHEAALWAKEQARLQAELLARQQAALEQQLRFRRGLLVEAEALGQTQDISRPWVYSYFTLLQLLGLSDPMSDPSTPQADLAKEMT